MHSIIPHLLLPPLLFLPFYLPPFPHRNTIFGTAIIGTVILNTLNTFPDERTLRYGLSGAWIIYFPVLEKLLLHPEPERDFWRLDRRPHEAEYMGPFSMAKARWAAALLSSPRGVGWSHGSKRMPSGPVKTQERLRFVVGQVKSVALATLALEALLILNEHISASEEWNLTQLPTIILVDLLMGLSVYVTWTTQYSVAAGLSVSTGLSKPTDWPPMFGSIRHASTIGGFWGSFWHGILRQPSLAVSKSLVRCLGLRPRSNPAYVMHLTNAFLLSTFWHVISIAPVAENHISISQLVLRLSAFFMAQVPAILAETALLGPRKDDQSKKTDHASSKTGSSIQQTTNRQVIGCVGVFLWLGLSGWSFFTVYRAVGLLDTKHPFPVIRTVLSWFGVHV
ncbi:hypothetical protein F5X68DRAFT_212568 [Plectosphaerella plurivora]|uniref:Wax synthase domain-containing protein n=1 Tax=Plectosphaerella plurivora TaxID=936078 RepID=A0A9P8V6Z1_9PEZI|nr:hypothetical protein F5X68DRAFT_212568 [Plectosphaerella plurivora]